VTKLRVLGALEIALLVVLGLIALLSLCGVLVALIPDSATGRVGWSDLPLCLGPLIGSAGSTAMILLRNRARGISAPLVASVPLWFVGSGLLSTGLFVLLAPSEDPFLTNLGYSVALCMTPGGILTALGLGAYWYAYVRGGLKEAVMDRLAENQTGEFSQVMLAAGDRADTLKRAAEYRRNILALLHERSAPLAGPLADLPGNLDAWEARVRQLVERLAKLEVDALTERDRREVPGQIAHLEDQLAAEMDPDVQRQLQETLTGRRQQQAQLDALAALMRRTRLQLDETLAAMGTIYSQLQVMAAMEIDGSHAARLNEDINRQTAALADLLAGMAEVYAAPARAAAPPDYPARSAGQTYGGTNA
jgi:hypothetical protein